MNLVPKLATSITEKLIANFTQQTNLMVRFLGNNDDADLVRVLYQSSNDFFKETTGRQANDSDINELVTSLPPNKTFEDKHLIGFFEHSNSPMQENLVGILDLIQAYPEEKTWTIGLLIIQPKMRRRSFGRKIINSLECSLKEIGANKLRCIVDDENHGAQLFWSKMGFFGVEQTYQCVDDKKRSVQIYIKFV